MLPLRGRPREAGEVRGLHRSGVGSGDREGGGEDGEAERGEGPGEAHQRAVDAALADGAADPSPNAGVSQAAYAHAVGVQLGGANRYGGQWRQKPLLVQGQPLPDRAAILKILALSRRLEALWLALALGVAWAWLQ